jgi:hypothetical protein
MIVRLLIALLLGALAYFIAGLFLAHGIAVIIGLGVAIVYFVSGDSVR